MKLHKLSFGFRLVAIVASLFVVSSNSFAGDRFNFGYRATGESDLRPVQAFDDGERTYLQMRGQVVPVVLVTLDGKQIQLPIARVGENLVLPAVSNEFILKYATLSARVTNTGKPSTKTSLVPGTEIQLTGVSVAPSAGALTQPPVVQPTTFGPTKPLVGDYSSDTPFLEKQTLVGFAKGSTKLSKESAAKVLASLVGHGAPVKVVITGRDDQAYVEGMALARGIAIRDRVIAAGVPLERIVVKEGIARDSESNFVTSDLLVVWKTTSDTTSAKTQANSSAPAAQKSQPQATPAAAQATPNEAHGKWEMTKADQTISAMLARWASSEGWTLVWTAPAAADPKITGEATIVADEFTDAVKLVLAQANKMGYPLTHSIKNKVLTIK